MRHPTTHSFLKWAGPALLASAALCLGLLLTAGGMWPGVKTWTEGWYYWLAPVVTATWFLVLMVILVLGYVGGIIYTGGPTAIAPEALTASKARIDVADVLYVDGVPVTDEWQVATTPLWALFIALQVTNGNENGATLRGVQAHAENEFGDRIALDFRRDGMGAREIDIRHGAIELLDVGFVVTSPEIKDFGVMPRAGDFRQPLPHAVIDPAMREAFTSDFRLYLGGSASIKYGNKTEFRVIITAEDVPSFRQVFRLNFEAERPYDWLEQVEGKG